VRAAELVGGMAGCHALIPLLAYWLLPAHETKRVRTWEVCLLTRWPACPVQVRYNAVLGHLHPPVTVQTIEKTRFLHVCTRFFALHRPYIAKISRACPIG
jgi:hypothetical protein